MTTTVTDEQATGKKRFAAMGYALRVIKALPTPIRERLLDKVVGGVSSELPSFPDTLRLVEAANGIPDGTMWQKHLLDSRPDLRHVRVSEVSDDRHGRVRGRLYRPPRGVAPSTAALVWVHGGAFVIGSLDQKEAHWPAVELAASGIPVLSVDYRLALNGVHYPAPMDDVFAAWQWAVSHCDRLGVQPHQLHLGGASAGGCLAASVTLQLRDSDLDMPASTYLAYPALEGQLPAPSSDAAKALTVPGLLTDDWVADMYANWAGSADWADPLVSPGQADLSGLPPTYVLTCGLDILRRSSEPYVRRLADAGVSVRHDLFPDSRHAIFDRTESDEGVRAVSGLRDWLIGGGSAKR